MSSLSSIADHLKRVASATGTQTRRDVLDVMSKLKQSPSQNLNDKNLQDLDQLVGSWFSFIDAGPIPPETTKACKELIGYTTK